MTLSAIRNSSSHGAWTMWVCLPFLLFFSTVGVMAQGMGAQSAEANIPIVLQSDSPGVISPKIVDGRLVVSVTFSSSVMKAGDRTIQFQSLEPGTIRNVDFSAGALVAADETLTWMKLRRASPVRVFRQAIETECRARLRFRLVPETAEKQYEQEMSRIRSDVDKTKDLPADPIARERTVNRLIREQCAAAIKSLRPGGADRKSVRMGPTRLFDSPNDPVSDLRDAYRWWQFDKLLSEVDERPDDGWADAKKLAFGQEIMDLLSGAITEDQTKLLTAAQRRKLIQGCEFRIAFDFEPAPTEKRPDERWRQAFRVRFGDDGPTAAVWSTSVGGTGAPGSDWLDLGPAAGSARPQLAIRGEPGSVATMWVTGPDEGLYLRVIPRDGKSAAAVRLELSAGSGERSIEIPERSRAAAKFPF